MNDLLLLLVLCSYGLIIIMIKGSWTETSDSARDFTGKFALKSSNIFLFSNFFAVTLGKVVQVGQNHTSLRLACTAAYNAQ